MDIIGILDHLDSILLSCRLNPGSCSASASYDVSPLMWPMAAWYETYFELYLGEQVSPLRGISQQSGSFLKQKHIGVFIKKEKKPVWSFFYMLN